MDVSEIVGLQMNAVTVLEALMVPLWPIYNAISLLIRS